MVTIHRTKNKEEFEIGVQALTEIFIDEYPYYATWISKNKEQFEKGEKQILTIYDNSNVVGYIMIHFCTNEYVKINGIYIFENYKGKGLATEALNNLVTFLNQQQVNLIFVQTRLDNNAVVHLFDKTKFNLIGTNYHSIEQRDNWVACKNIGDIGLNEQIIASQLYEGFCPLTTNEIAELRDKHKNGNLVLKKSKKSK